MKIFLISAVLATVATRAYGEGIIYALFCEHQTNVQSERGSKVFPCYDIDDSDLAGDDPCELFVNPIKYENTDIVAGGDTWDDEWTDFEELVLFFITCSAGKDERAGLCRYDSGADQWYRDDYCKADGHEAIIVKVADGQRRRNLRSNPSSQMQAMATGMRALGNGNGKTPPGQFKKVAKEAAETVDIDGKTFRVFGTSASADTGGDSKGNGNNGKGNGNK